MFESLHGHAINVWLDAYGRLDIWHRYPAIVLVWMSFDACCLWEECLGDA
jgi:hypothetical protein